MVLEEQYVKLFIKWLPEIGPQRDYLGRFHRYPLKRYYLQRDYNAQYEPYWHMVDEYYDYGPTTVGDNMDIAKEFSLSQNYPDPINNLTSIRFHLPYHGKVLVEILSDNANRIAVLVNSQMNSGTHLLSWDGSNYPSGIYYCRIFFSGITRIQKMIVLH